MILSNTDTEHISNQSLSPHSNLRKVATSSFEGSLISDIVEQSLREDINRSHTSIGTSVRLTTEINFLFQKLQ